MDSWLRKLENQHMPSSFPLSSGFYYYSCYNLSLVKILETHILLKPSSIYLFVYS